MAQSPKEYKKGLIVALVRDRKYTAERAAAYVNVSIGFANRALADVGGIKALRPPITRSK